MYHGVTDKNIKGVVENYDGKHIFAKKFEQQINFLSQRYNIISLQQLIENLSARIKLPKNAVMITFDDGYSNNYYHALPILKKMNVPATIFICPGLIEKNKINWPDFIESVVLNSSINTLKLNCFGQKQKFSLKTNKDKINTIIAIKTQLLKLGKKERNKIIHKLVKILKPKQNNSNNYSLMNWTQLQDIIKHNISIGSHTTTHPILITESRDIAYTEIKESKQMIESKLKNKITAFAYPNGILNKNVKDLVEKAGYACAFTTIGTKNICLKDKFAIKRIPITNNQNNMFFLFNQLFNFNKILFLFRKWLQ